MADCEMRVVRGGDEGGDDAGGDDEGGGVFIPPFISVEGGGGEANLKVEGVEGGGDARADVVAVDTLEGAQLLNTVT